MRLLLNILPHLNICKGNGRCYSKDKPPVEAKASPVLAKVSSKNAAEKSKSPSLLPYPVVPLKETLNRYLLTVQPLLTPDAYKDYEKVTREFERKEGDELQCLLIKAGRADKNWLAKRWARVAYLEFRAPVTIFTSPGLSFPQQELRHTMEYVNYAAKLIYGMGEFKLRIHNGQIPVTKMDQYQLDNSQFCKIFGSVRRPCRCRDCLEQYPDSNYVIVIKKNFFYKLPIYDAQGRLINVNVLTDALWDIFNCETCLGLPIGLLTHDTRDNWAEAYEVMKREPKNCEVINVIEQALFSVSLDEEVKPAKGEERNVHGAQLLHGGGQALNSANRWMDKTLQLIVNPNGMAGFCFEHAPADCQPIAMMMDYIQKQLVDPSYGCGGSKEDFEVVSTLSFSEGSNPDCLALWMKTAERNIALLSQMLQLHIFKFECHGKDFIKAQGLSPDSYIQMALQLAFYRVHRQLPVQYESAHLRIFDGGRTEVIRSTSLESSAFVQAMTEKQSTQKERLMALRAAVDGHQEYTKLALQGRGVDRHLMGLQQMAREHGRPQPDFFCSKSYKRTMHYRVCSSQVATNHESFMAYGPLTADGYGCCYNPRSCDIIFSVSSWRSCQTTNAQRYGQAIEQALEEIRKLVLATGGDQSAMDPCKCKGK